MVRDQRWKLIEYVVGNEHHTQLFDLLADPDELNNLADQKQNGEVLVRLRAQLLRLAAQFEDPDAAVYRQAFAGDVRAN
jgi:hypothetical protein